MGKETRCAPAVRIKQRRDWFVPLVAATILGAALLILLVLGLYDGGSAQADPREQSCSRRGT